MSNKLQDVIEFNTTETHLKTCKHCHKKSFKQSYLGTSKDGNRLFEGRCLLGCCDFVFMITPKGKYLRSGNLNE